MKNTRFLTAAGSLVLAGLAGFGSALAHHSHAGEFDASVDFELRGEVTEIEWFNPHVWIYLNASRDGSSVDEWQCALGSPNSLLRRGWRKEDLPLGTVIRIQANPARDGSNTCDARSVALDDGTPVFGR